MNRIAYREVTSVREACESVAEDGSRVLAGGTALALLLRQGLVTDDRLVGIGRVEALRRIEAGPQTLSIGAMVTHRDAAASDLVKADYPALAAVFASVASPRIRNAATVGGNLAHGDPHLDPPVALLALDSTIIAESVFGTRRIKLSQFFVDYYETSLESNEILTSVEVPRLEQDVGFAALKFLTRSRDDYATVDVAVWLRLRDNVMSDARIGLGSVGPTVFRPTEAEDSLKGATIDDSSALMAAGQLASASADPESDVRGSAGYKRELLKVLVPRVIRDAARSVAQGPPFPSPPGNALSTND